MIYKKISKLNLKKLVIIGIFLIFNAILFAQKSNYTDQIHTQYLQLSNVNNQARQTTKPITQLFNNNLIINIKNPIVKTNDSLIIIGNNISYLKYTSYPDSGKLNFIFKEALANFNTTTNTSDTAYYFIIPANFENKLYPLHGIGYDNTISNLKIIRVYNFNLDSVGIVGWGSNIANELSIPTGLKNVVQLCAGDYSSLALKVDGTVVGWGDGQIQFGGKIDVPIWVKDLVSIDLDGYFRLGLKSDGTVVAWGYNGQGQTNIPVNLDNVIQISAGSFHSLALKEDGTVVAWGTNEFGESSVPIGLTNIVQVAAGFNFNVCLKNDGTVIAWGKYLDDEKNYTWLPIFVPSGLTNVKQIRAGENHVLVLKSDNNLYAWGRSREGQTIIPIGINNILDFDAGYLHNLVLQKDGNMIAWGNNSYNESTIPFCLKNVVYIASPLSSQNLAISRLYIKTDKNNGGNISPTQFVKNGDNIRVTYQPDMGYKLDSIFINDVYQPLITTDSTNGYTFKNINKYQCIRIVFSLIPIQFCITTKVINGNISPYICIDSGTNYRITYNTNTGFKLDSIFINEIYQSHATDSLTGYTFKNINNNASIRVVFKFIPPPKQFCISPQVTNGNISPYICIDSGTNYRITYSSLFNFRLDSIYINNVYNGVASQDSQVGFTFYNINQHNEIRVVFYNNDKIIEPSDILTPTLIDGQFDDWQIKNIDAYPENEISIYNKFNIEVIHFENYSNKNAWTGIDRYGTKLTSGVYYFIIKLKFKNQLVKILKGTLTLLN